MSNHDFVAELQTSIYRLQRRIRRIERLLGRLPGAFQDPAAMPQQEQAPEKLDAVPPSVVLLGTSPRWSPK